MAKSNLPGVHHPSNHMVRKICKLLQAKYSLSFLGNKRDPLNEYLYIILSLRTHERGFTASYKSFKRRFPSWSLAHKTTVSQIASCIKVGGLARQRASRIKSALKYIHETLGELSLRTLRKWPQPKVESFLLKLPGVGPKSARCIMMYSLGFRVLPVDTHVARISKRLGWISGNNPSLMHRNLEDIVPPKLRFLFHVCCVPHGRSVCRGQAPRCSSCCLEICCPKIGASHRQTIV